MTELHQEIRKREQIQRAYYDLLQSPHAKLVMEDLARFCRANASTFEQSDPNGRVSAFREGRREVYLRIMQMAALKPEEAPNA